MLSYAEKQVATLKPLFFIVSVCHVSSAISKIIMAHPHLLIMKPWKERVGGGAEVQGGDENFHLENIILMQGNGCLTAD